jgi:hypothetical protein
MQWLRNMNWQPRVVLFCVLCTSLIADQAAVNNVFSQLVMPDLSSLAPADEDDDGDQESSATCNVAAIRNVSSQRPASPTLSASSPKRTGSNPIKKRPEANLASLQFLSRMRC